jgi:tRNA A37 threonylcarbamoyladenosine synthetase subunit TsaC/SUA5/YrdC
MARKKDPPKPLFAVKHDFVESLDAFVQATMTLHQIVSTVIDLDQVKSEPILAKLREANDRLSEAMLTKD